MLHTIDSHTKVSPRQKTQVPEPQLQKLTRRLVAAVSVALSADTDPFPDKVHEHCDRRPSLSLPRLGWRIDLATCYQSSEATSAYDPEKYGRHHSESSGPI